MLLTLNRYWRLLPALLVLLVAVTSPAFASEYIVDEHTVGLWHLNEGAGAVVADATGNHNGTLVGNAPPTWTSGKYDDGLHLQCCFNSSANQCGAVELGNGLFNLPNSTIEMYLKYDYQTSGPNPADTGFVGYLFHDGQNTFARVNIDTSNPQRWYGRITYGVYTNAGWIEISTPHEYCLDADVWTHVAFVRLWDGVNTIASIYVDGELAVTGSRANNSPFSGTMAYIGHVSQNNVSFGGGIDEIKISDIARTDFGGVASGSCGDWGYVLGDFDQDCYISFKDVVKIADEWLSCTLPLETDIYTSGCVDFRDYTLFADNWRQCSNPADSNCTPGYDQALNFENANYFCSLLIGSGINDHKGLRWGKLYEKSNATQYLYPADNMPLFRVFGDGFSVDSTDFDVNNISRTIQGQSHNCQISLSCPAYQLSATMNIQTDETDKMRWSLDIQNDGSTRRLQPVFPLMGRIKIGESLNDNKYFYPWRGGLVGDIDCYLQHEYSGLAWMQVISVFNPTVGVGLFTYPEDSNGGFKGMPFKKSYGFGDQTVQHSEIVLQRERPNTGDTTQPVDLLSSVSEGIAYAYYYPGHEIATGEDYQIPDTVIGVYQGNWKEPLTDYSTWAHTWYTHVDTDQWFKNCFNSVGAWPGYYYSESLGRYVLSERMNDPDPMHLEQWAMWWDYSDIDNPFSEAGDFYYNVSRGGLSAFAAEIAAVQAKGGRMSVYIDNRFNWQYTDIGSTMGQQWATMDPPGVYSTYQGPDDKWMECAYEPNAWVDYLTETCARIVHDTGMDAIYLDELPLMYPCYNTNHVHYQQDAKPFSVDRMRQFLTQARAAIRAENPEAVLYTEHAGSDYFTQFYDGSWDQTYFQPYFAHAEQYYDEFSISYFRFCFPEFKLLYWGPSNDWERRSFFSGMGICDWPLSGYEERSGQLMKENGDVFATLTPEPIISTYIDKILANKFPIAAKTLYTVYNKDANDYLDTAIMQVEHRPGFHYVEIFEDDNNITVNSLGLNDELVFSIPAGEVLCIAQFPEIIQTAIDGNTVNVTLAQYQGDETLVAFINYDNSAFGFGSGEIIPLTSGQGQTDIPDWLGSGKIIFKLFRGDILLDEVVLGSGDGFVSGTIALWHMDEGTGTVAYDSENGNNNLQLGAQYYWTSGAPNTPPGYALATPYYCDTHCSSWINPSDITDQVTVSAWIRPANVDPDGSYIVTMDKRFLLRISSGKTAIHMVVQTPDSVWHQVDAEPLGSGVPITDGKWHHVAGVYDGRTDVSGNVNIHLYWDGQLIATESFSAPPGGQPLMDGGSGTVNIGASSTASTTTNYRGAIDEVIISNEVIEY